VNCNSDNEEDDGFQIVCKEDEPELTDEIYPLIRKVRSVVKLFRRSPTKNDEILQKYIKAAFGKEIQLMIDVKIRWNSLHSKFWTSKQSNVCINGYWSIKATRSQWAVWIGIWQRDSWSRNWFAGVHAREASQEMNSKICSKLRTTKDVMGIVKKELAIFEVEIKLGANLESCYENLNSILPSSVEPERVFLDVEELLPK
jgi:hypothetical protein